MRPLALLVVPLLLAACGGAERDAAEPAPATAADEPPLALAGGWSTDFRRHSVPYSEFRSGGPGKDDIPPIDRPKFVPVAGAGFLESREPVIEVVVEDDARAYPIQVLIWHEIVNDEVGGVPVAVTFCPLCNTALVFDRRVVGDTLSFGTTGNLRNSDLVMYDRQTESWWQQFGGEGLAGRYTGARLTRVPSRMVAWEQFAREHPDGRVLSRDTGFARPYGENPYVGYDSVDSPPIFPTAHAGDDRLEPKERVVFVERKGESVAIAYSALRRRQTIEVEVGGHRLTVRWRGGVASSLDDEEVSGGRDVGAAEVRERGKLVPFDEPFWFAVAAFRPDVRVIR